MLIRGLFIAAAGFLFIFSPGVPIRLLLRQAQAIRRSALLQGIVIWLVALLPALFFQSLLRQIAAPAGTGGGEPAPGPWLTLGGTLLAAFFLQGLIYLILRRQARRQPGADLTGEGLHLGFGVGLIAQVFTGLNLVGAGFRLALGSTEGAILQALAAAPGVDLAAGLLAMIAFRIALLAVSAALGVVLARAAMGGRRLFWLAVLLEALFSWLILVVQRVSGAENPGLMLAGSVDLATSLISLAYYLAAFALAFWWVRGQVPPPPAPTMPSRRTKRVAH